MPENIIFCFSGTGNCLDAAKQIARELGDTDIIMLRQTPERTDARGAKRIGFLFPCHAGGLPEGMEALLRTLRFDASAYVFAVCLCAAYPGNGLAVIDRMFRLDYWTVLTHQCSCIWLFPHTLMAPPLSPEGAQARAEREAKRIAARVRKGIRSEKPPAASGLFSLEHRFWPSVVARQAKRFTVGPMCVGCGTCARLCPRGNIQIAGGKPVFGTDCVQCLGCLQFCPQEAIRLGRVTERREHYHNPNVTARELSRGLLHFD